MRIKPLIAAGAVLLGIAGGPLRAQPAAPAATAGGQPTIGEAREAIGSLDTIRLMSDAGYAEEALRNLDVVLAAARADRPVRTATQALRAIALATLERRDESIAAIDAVLTSGMREPWLFALAWLAASVLPDPAKMVAVVEAGARELPPDDRPAFNENLTPEIVFNLYHHLRANENADRYRLAEALVALGWPGDSAPVLRDSFRGIMLNRRIEQGDRAAAARLAAAIRTPDEFLPLILLRRYDGLIAADEPVQALNAVLAEHDRVTRRLLAEAPQEHQRVLDRAQFLRSVGREEEAYAVLAPFTADIPATVAADFQGMWLVNEAAYSLLAQGRADDAVALMSRLVELDMADHPDLIGPSINFASILWAAGRPAEALRHAERVERDFAQHANDYGRMWIASAVVCSLASLGRQSEAAPQLERLRAQRDDNPAALLRALLCLGDLDEAEAVMVARLEDDEPGPAVKALQDYMLHHPEPQAEALYQRLALLRDRPAVRAALDRVGRSLRLPLSRTYWGEF